MTEDVGLVFSHQSTVHKMKANTNLGSVYVDSWSMTGVQFCIASLVPL